MRDSTKFPALGKLTRGISAQLIGSISKVSIQFFTGIILARLVAPEDFGIVGIAYVFTGFAIVVTDLGLGQSVVQIGKLSIGHIQVCHTVSIALGLIMSVVSFLFAGPIANFFGDIRVEFVIQLLSITFVTAGASITPKSILARDLEFTYLAKSEVISYGIGNGFTSIILAIMGYGYMGLAVGALVGSALYSIVLNFRVSYPKLPFYSRSKFRDLIGFGAGVSIGSTANYFAKQGDYFLIGKYLDTDSLGLYSRAYSLMQIPYFLLGRTLSRVVFPVASRIRDNSDEFKNVFALALGYSVALALPVSLAICILASEIVYVLYGPEWMGMVAPLQILAVFGWLRMSYNTAGAFVLAKGSSVKVMVGELAYGIIVLVGGWSVIERWGLIGVAWIVGLAILTIWIMLVSFARADANVPLKHLFKILSGAVLPGIICGLFILATKSVAELYINNLYIKLLLIGISSLFMIFMSYIVYIILNPNQIITGRLRAVPIFNRLLPIE